MRLADLATTIANQAIKLVSMEHVKVTSVPAIWTIQTCALWMEKIFAQIFIPTMQTIAVHVIASVPSLALQMRLQVHA
jgi:hypothetical protein